MSMSEEAPDTPDHSVTPNRRALEVLLAFLKLGLTAFGGPVAHLGYFRTEFVERRGWLDDKAYADLVALCQFLPGPASSQVGIALGLGRAGWLGALAAWLGFTLPSAILLVLFASSVAHWPGLASSGMLHGLKIVAVAVVAQALGSMARALCPDRRRGGIAILVALIVLVADSALAQLGGILLGGLLGWRMLSIEPPPAATPPNDGVSGKHARYLLLLWLLLLAGLPILARVADSSMLAGVAIFYQAGSLVFGGGHVVLPLLQASLVPPGWLSNDTFLAGYAAAQAVPGPLFTVAAFLGTTMPPGGWLNGLVMLSAIFLPAFLLVLGALPFWATLRRHLAMQRALAGINASVVGILGAAMYDPIWTHSIHTTADFCLALAAYGLLVHARLPPVAVVLLGACGGGILLP